MYNCINYLSRTENRVKILQLLCVAMMIIYFVQTQLATYFTYNCIVERPKSNSREKFKMNLTTPEMTDIEKNFKRIYHFENGGEHVPVPRYINISKSNDEKCNLFDNSKYKVAIIIPIRDRDAQLGIFLNNMIPYLARQKLNFKIFLVEPLHKLAFNRGLLLNIGYVEVSKESDKWNCFIFHDVDCLPENLNTFYECHDQYPLHYTVAISDSNYTTSGYYNQSFGGVVAFTKDQFNRINGYSNLFYGWGSEDDDLYQRSILAFSKVLKQPADIGRYYMLEHEKAKPFPIRYAIQYDYSRYTDPNKREGLNNLADLYKIKIISKRHLFTKFVVSYANTSKLLEPYYADKSEHWKPYYPNVTQAINNDNKTSTSKIETVNITKPFETMSRNIKQS